MSRKNCQVKHAGFFNLGGIGYNLTSTIITVRKAHAALVEGFINKSPLALIQSFEVLALSWTEEINDFCSCCIYVPTAPGIINATCGETNPTMHKTLTPNPTISRIRHKYHDPFAKL
jgi:hypothetical protein